MVIFSIHKRHLSIVVILFIFVFAWIVFMTAMGKKVQYRSLLTAFNSTGKYVIAGFLTSHIEQNNIEIFDIGKGKVIKEIHTNEIAIKEAKKFLTDIKGMYGKVKAFPNMGYIIKIPFETEFEVNNHFLNDNGIMTIDKIFIVMPEVDNPYLLVLDGKEKPYFYVFSREINTLLESLGLLNSENMLVGLIKQTDWENLSCQEQLSFLERLIMINYGPQIKEAVDEYYEELRGFDLLEITDVKVVEPYKYELKIKISTFVGAHNPPYGIDIVTIRFKHLNDGKVVSYEQIADLYEVKLVSTKM